MTAATINDDPDSIFTLSDGFLSSEYHTRGTNESNIYNRAENLASYFGEVSNNYTFMGVGCVSRLLMTSWVLFLEKNILPKEIVMFDINPEMIIANRLYLAQENHQQIITHFKANSMFSKKRTQDMLKEFMNLIKGRIQIVTTPTSINPDYLNITRTFDLYDLSNIHNWLQNTKIDDIVLSIPNSSVLLFSALNLNEEYEDDPLADPRLMNRSSSSSRLQAKWARGRRVLDES